MAIAAGGAVGALLRYWISGAIHTLHGRDFPHGTLFVNILGSLAIGFLYVILFERVAESVTLRAFLLIGLLGSLTTFSTFSIETINLLQTGEYGKAVLNIMFNVFLCLGAAWLGIAFGRQL